MENQVQFLKRPVVVVSVALVCCFLWGSAFASVALGYELLGVDLSDTFHIFLFAGSRFLISSSLIFLFALVTGRSMKVSFKDLRRISILGLMQTFGQYVFFFLSMRTVHPANGSILSSFSVFFTVIIASFVFKTDRLTSLKFFGLCLGLIGIMVLHGGMAESFSLTGEGFMVISMLLGASSGVYTKKLTRDLSPYVITGYQLLLGSLLLISLGLAFGQTRTFTFNLASSSILVYLGFISAAAFTLWSALLKHNNVSKVSIYKFLIPIFGVFIAFIVMGDAINIWTTLLSMTLVATGIFLIQLDVKHLKHKKVIASG